MVRILQIGDELRRPVSSCIDWTYLPTRRTFTSIMKHVSEYDFVLIARRFDAGDNDSYFGSLDCLDRLLCAQTQTPLDIVHICASHHYDLLSRYEEVNGMRLAVTANVAHTSIVLLSSRLAGIFARKAKSDHDLLNDIAQTAYRGRIQINSAHDEPEYMYVTSVALLPQPMQVNPAIIADRNEVARICNSCTAPSELKPASIDNVYYFFGAIVILMILFFSVLLMRMK